MTLDQFQAAFRERLATADISQVKADVLPFLNNPHETDIWSNEYFLLLSDQMKIQV